MHKAPTVRDHRNWGLDLDGPPPRHDMIIVSDIVIFDFRLRLCQHASLPAVGLSRFHLQAVEAVAAASRDAMHECDVTVM